MKAATLIHYWNDSFVQSLKNRRDTVPGYRLKDELYKKMYFPKTMKGTQMPWSITSSEVTNSMTNVELHQGKKLVTNLSRSAHVAVYYGLLKKKEDDDFTKVKESLIRTVENIYLIQRRFRSK
jgi:hypothetical protein